jgi:transcriptional regulator with XRE-family HTH domain
LARKRATRKKSTRLAQKLKRIREQLDLSQNELLDQLGYADELFRSNISQYERGDRVPSLHVLLAYSRLASIDLEVLIDDDLSLPDKISNSTTRGLARSRSR